MVGATHRIPHLPAERMSTLDTTSDRPRAGLVPSLIKLARPHQWAKGAFVVVGPAYGVATDKTLTVGMAIAVVGAFLAFGFASSSCYVFNDLRDRESDKLHPRKRNRPIASGAVSLSTAKMFSLTLLGCAAAASLLAAFNTERGPWTAMSPALWLAVFVAGYVVNTTLYSIRFKHVVVLDVMSLAIGFVVRVLGGCAAAGVKPSPFLLNCTFFVSMFLAFGKRLGERRTMGDQAGAARAVQMAYTDELLRMAVIVTGVVSLVSYAGYVQDSGTKYEMGFNLLWLTILPATYGLFRCIVLLERGQYDDPTELAAQDRPFQAALALFGLITVAVMVGLHK
jgi:decaprenyl-phosphate phosphoribosyltransferase